MAQKILVMGESGTGKSTSMRNFTPEEIAVVNPVNKPLPFKGSGKFEMLNAVTESDKIVRFMKDVVKKGKKVIVVDDFQYILSIPYMNRIKEAGWDKWNDFGANYFEIIDVCAELPDDVTVFYLTHTETLENGVTTIKLIGKLLREKITIEGLFTIVLRTQVIDGKYYFLTQNSGKDTVKSPMGMFPAYAIENDLKYVDEKIRNYYEIGAFKSDAELAQADQAVASDIAKPDINGRRARASARAATPLAESGRKTRTHDEVVAENHKKIGDYMEAVDKAISDATGGAEEVPFEQASAIADTVPKPELEQPPRRTRAERVAKDESPADVLETDTYFYIEATDNYIMKHKGDVAPEGGKVISFEEFGEGIKRIAQEGNTAESNFPINPPEETPGEKKVRQRKNRTATQANADATPAPAPAESDAATTGRRRRTR